MVAVHPKNTSMFLCAYEANLTYRKQPGLLNLISFTDDKMKLEIVEVDLQTKKNCHFCSQWSYDDE